MNDPKPLRSKTTKVRFGPAGVHLFERQSGLNVLMDEIQVPLSAWSPAPRQVSIALTNACDLACDYCYAPKMRASLDFDRLTTWLTDLDAGGAIGVGFGGGEPTLYTRLAELCRWVHQKTALAVTLTTHGHHLSDTLIHAIAGSVNFIRVSMDGIGPTYEELRGRPFDTLLQRFSSLQGKIPFGINYLVNSRTLPELDRAVALAYEIGATEFLLLPEQVVRGKGGIDQVTMLQLGECVRDYRGTIRLSINEGNSEGLPTCYPFAAESGILGYAHIDALGTLKRSSYEATGVPILADGIMAALQRLAL
jgi:MoaA/NifB/PqqE/SkfB family radical SAM enzyme